MIIVFTGNGKGKTTASLGQMVRVLGRGKKALMIQFIKGPWRSGEDEFAAKFQIPDSIFHIEKMGLGFVGILGDKLPREEHEKAAEKAIAHFEEESRSGKWHLIILDEINVAVSLGLLSAARVVEAVKNYPENRILMLTGRNAPQEFLDLADLATEMREIKHPFQSGERAKFTVEF
ncbi:MAG: cob(I)yrinic acid a,c-diamide adenosyltransferase [Patescibacteria group bacterium]|nr:cob(I)yrinic acid a,c-diamide adenosyltransferase [Patescibacteria group bacterium]MDE2015103.1 cob(I)yrinic acid a,c-diamide adenosyltransferase [Patescibacteria group bacterium]MDE2226531.1 cob(I)yrinic acid a,c-diamide adenosyltransferase [Patescibacteria group bacterium]